MKVTDGISEYRTLDTSVAGMMLSALLTTSAMAQKLQSCTHQVVVTYDALCAVPLSKHVAICVLRGNYQLRCFPVWQALHGRSGDLKLPRSVEKMIQCKHSDREGYYSLRRNISRPSSAEQRVHRTVLRGLADCGSGYLECLPWCISCCAALPYNSGCNSDKQDCHLVVPSSPKSDNEQTCVLR
jgi:hypothetical protein